MAYTPTLDQLNQDRPSQSYTPSLDELNQDRPQSTQINNWGLFGQDPSEPGNALSHWFTTPHKELARKAFELEVSAVPGIGAESLAAPYIARGAGLLGDALGGSKYVKQLSSLLGSSVSGAAGGAASGATYGALEPADTFGQRLENSGKSAEQGAEFGSLLNPTGKIAGSVLSTQIPGISRILSRVANKIGGLGKSGSITPEEVAHNISMVPEGIKLPLGNINNSPLLQRTQGAISALPWSGYAKPIDQLNNFYRESFDNLQSNTPSNVSNPNEYIYDKYEKEYLSARSNTHDIYTKLGESGDLLAESNPNNKFDDNSFKSAIQKALDEINPQIVNKTSEKAYAPIADFLNDFKNNTPVNDFKTATNVGKALNHLYGQYLETSDGMMRRYINQAKKGLEDSINDNAEKFPQLNELREAANKARQYQAEFENHPDGGDSPFYKIYNRPRVTNTGHFISDYIKPSKGNIDNSALTHSLTDKLSAEDKRFLFNQFISPTGDETVSQKLRNTEKLNNTQRLSLLGDDKPLTDQIIHLKRMVPDSANPGFVPKTGFTGNKVSDVLAASIFPKILIGTGFGRAATSALRSNTLRDMYLKALQNSGTKNINPLTDLLPHLSSISQAAKYPVMNLELDKYSGVQK